MLNIGCHLSVSKGFLHMGKVALEIKANTFQFFTRNPRGGKAKALDLQDIAAYRALAEENRFAVIMAHAPYTLNLCSSDDKVQEFAQLALADDLQRMESIPGSFYNFHPGSHTGRGVESGVRQIIDALNAVIRPEQTTTILLETMSGKGSEIGSTFEELQQIIEGVRYSEKMGVCLDTCHVHDSGYDIVNDLDGVLDTFDSVIGFERLRAIHLNDSMNPLGSHKDRHEKIGRGTIGLEALVRIIRHPKLRRLPFYLETPNELDGYAEEIDLLRKAYDAGE